MLETEARLLLAKMYPHGRWFKNSVGFVHQGERTFRYGLVKGSSDLIGWLSVVITPDMVGQRVAIFSALEVKDGSGRPSKEQLIFLRAVELAGGIASVIRDEADVVQLGLVKR